MEFTFHFAYPLFGLAALCAIALAVFLRRLTHKPVLFHYSLVTFFKKHVGATSQLVRQIPWLLRLLSLLGLAAIIARPQLVDQRSKVHKEGIDIAMVLDVSGSMQCFDDLQDPRSRFEVAKTEALNFIQKRENDQIALILFGAVAMTRCPLTADKKILVDIINKLKLGDINPDGTVLSIAISMAVQRLSNSKAKSKIIVLLTDGEPTPGLDIEPELAIDLAKKFGIKIYTIGIGGEHGGLIINPVFNIAQSMGFRLNKELLETIARETGGQFFHAKNPQDLAKIYGIIDKLERTEYETTQFARYHEYYLPFLALAALALLIELILTTFVWFKI